MTANKYRYLLHRIGLVCLVALLAEILAGVSYSQLVRPGSPVIAGAFVTSIDMNSGAPTFGTPEAAHITYGTGQLVRRLGLPYRSGGSRSAARNCRTRRRPMKPRTA